MSYVTPMCRASSATELLRKVLEGLTAEEHEAGNHRTSWPQWDRNAPRGMPIHEFRHAWYRLEDTTRCAAWLPGRRLNYPFMAAEFLWIFCGRDDVEMISYYNKEIAKFSDDGKTFFGAYGPRWRGQIETVVENLRRDPDSRQAVVNIWRPEALTAVLDVNNLAGVHTFEGGTKPTKDVPCTLSMQYLLRHGKLEAGVVMRSSDAWLGLPYDLFNFSMLQRAVAAELKVLPGSLTLYIGSSHLYERNLADARRVLAADREYYDRFGRHPSSRVFVPPPPGLMERKIEKAEESIRRNYADADVDVEEVGDEWWWLTNILAYRTHKDAALLEEPWNLLESPV